MSTEGPVEFLGESDWDEQDLLTIDEAAERLEQELVALATALDGAGESEGSGLRARHRALSATLANIRSGPTDLARIR